MKKEDIGEYYEAIDFVRCNMEKIDLLYQAAEECIELSKAFLKYIRVLRGKSPTPVSKEEAMANIIEEISDLENALTVIGLQSDDEIKASKMDRWVERLNDKKKHLEGFDL